GHGAGIACGSRLLVPLARLGVILAPALVIEPADPGHGAGIACGSRLLPPLARLNIIFRGTLAVERDGPAIKHRTDIAFCSLALQSRVDLLVTILARSGSLNVISCLRKKYLPNPDSLASLSTLRFR